MAYLEPCEVRLVGAERRGRGSLLLAAAAVSATTHRKPAAAPRHKRPELLQAPSSQPQRRCFSERERLRHYQIGKIQLCLCFLFRTLVTALALKEDEHLPLLCLYL